jgi:Protein of unknown function (DUF1579)
MNCKFLFSVISLSVIVSACARPPAPPAASEQPHAHASTAGGGTSCSGAATDCTSCKEGKDCDCSHGTSLGEHATCMKVTTTPPADHSSPDGLAKLKALTSLSAQHALLKKLIGTWKTEVSYWTTPTSKPLVTKGISVARPIFNGRFVEEMFKGTHAGQPYLGKGLTGFDNVSKTYVSSWADSLATDISIFRGTYNEEKKTVVYDADMNCPMTGGPIKVRSTLEFINDKQHIYRSFYLKPNGEEVKQMEITYTRK